MRQSVSDVSGNADIMHTSYYTNTNSIAPQHLYETREKVECETILFSMKPIFLLSPQCKSLSNYI